ncbi:lysophospholipase [Candidatus Gracilibacteria bacterium]|nr:lysophospholipase [Candidatus Gracilibacteria bacterium]MCF7819057.1 lysophospholipase [Candidatus Gracilibacteria bacterium]
MEYSHHPVPSELEWEEVTFQTSDGFELSGWWMDNEAERTVLFFHGNAGNISHRTGQLFIFQRLGLNALLFDYRGYGKSEGKISSEEDLYRDAEAGWNFLTEEKNIDQKNIIIWGNSLGAAVALEIAQEKNIAGVVLESPFLSLREIAQLQYPFLPVRWLLKYGFENEKKIPHIQAPLILLHSQEDEVIPISHSEVLLDLAPSPKTLIPLTGAHLRMQFDSTKEYFRALKDFLDDKKLLSP